MSSNAVLRTIAGVALAAVCGSSGAVAQAPADPHHPSTSAAQATGQGQGAQPSQAGVTQQGMIGQAMTARGMMSEMMRSGMMGQSEMGARRYTMK